MAPPTPLETTAMESRPQLRVSARLQGLPADPTSLSNPPTQNPATPRLAPTAQIDNPSIDTPNPQTSSSLVVNNQTDNEDAPYPNQHEDPDPAPDSATEAEKEINKTTLRQYGSDMLDAYKEIPTTGEALWVDFLTAFRPHSIRSWTRPMLAKWVAFLTSRDIYVISGRRTGRSEALVELLYRKDHVSAIGNDKTTHRSTLTIPGSIHSNPPTSHPTPTSTFGQNNAHSQPNISTSGAPVPEDPEDDDDPDDSESGDPHRKKGANRDDHSHSVNDGPQNQNRQENDEAEPWKPRNNLGISGLMKAYIGKETFSGGWDEDLDNCLSVYETLSKMCQVTKAEMLQSLPVMLTKDALTYFSTEMQGCTDYDDATVQLRTWYNSEEKRARILTAWQNMKLSDDLSKSPDSSEVVVFRKFLARLMSLQKQLAITYQSDEQLRDRLLAAVDIPHIQTTLRDRIPSTSQQAANRIANQLSDKDRSAGSTPSANYIEDNEGHDCDAMYSLGKVFGGDAKRALRQPWRGGRGGRGRPYQPGRGADRDKSQRRFNPYWMRGIKGCFVCGEPHNANTRHPREQVTNAINRLKKRHPKALLTIEDLAAVVEMTEDVEEETQSADDAQWAEEGETEEDDDLAFVILHDNQKESDLDHMKKSEAKRLEVALANSAYIHGTSYETDMYMALSVIQDQLKRGEANSFDGVRLDTGANRMSVMSRAQFKAYVKEFGLKGIMKPAPDRTIRGIGGRRKAIGLARIQIPFSNLGAVMDVEFLIISDEVPSLLSMRDMYKNGMDISIQERYISLGDRKQKLAFENFFLIHRWTAKDMPYILYTEPELRRIHRGFGHPSVKAIENLLRRASNNQLDKNTMDKMRRIHESCITCKKNSQKPRRFKLTVGSENMRFNHRVYVDTMFLDNRPVIHLVDEATHFSAASFLRTQSTSEIWKAILRLWMHAYMGPPDFLAVDQGSAYVSREMKQSLEASGVTIDEAPIENPGSIGVVERYHAPLRSAYVKIRDSLDRTTSDSDCLQMAVYATNSTMGPEGLCPMLLVFGALPRPIRTTPCPTQLQRSNAIEEARKAVETEQAKRRVAFALRHPSSPKAQEISEKLRDLPSGSPVLVYRTKPKCWEGPFRFISVTGETAVIQMNRGRRIFRTTCVKPWVTSKLQEELPEDASTEQKDLRTDNSDKMTKDETLMASTTDEQNKKTPQPNNPDNITHPPGKIKVRKGSKEEKEFSNSRIQELEGLMKDGTFAPIKIQNIKGNPRIFGSRFVDEVKRAGKHLRRKSRLVAQNYADEDASYISTKAPTVQRFSQRLTLSIAASMTNMVTYTRDVTQAYVQSRTNLERPIYIRPPHEMRLPPDTVLHVVKPLYGIPESGLHWYLTYIHHHLDVLGMRRSLSDPCVLFRRSDNGLDGLIILQVDDTLGIGTNSFLQEEDKASKEFRSKPRLELSSTPTSFNGVNLVKDTQGKIHMDQKDKIARIKMPTTQTEFASQRALAQYVGVNTRPDVCAPIQLVAPGAKPSSHADFKSFAKTLKFLQATSHQGITMVPLDLRTARLVLVTDSSFANTHESKSQLGYMILLVDDREKANIVHYGSNKSKRIARSVLAAEMHALTLGFDYAFVIKLLLEEIIGRTVLLEALIDSKTLFNVIAKDASTAERRLQIDALALRESYAIGELSRIGWIPGTTNPADSLTKCVLTESSPLFCLMKTNRYAVNPSGWATARREPEMSECQNTI